MSKNKVKLSDFTVKVLKNHQTIDNRLFVRKTTDKSGTKIIVRSGGIIAMYDVPESFSENVMSMDLDKILNIHSNMKEPEIELANNHMNIVDNDDKSNVVLMYAAPEMVEFPEPPARYPEFVVDFELREQDVTKVLKFADIMGLPSLRFRAENGTLYFEAFDADKKTDNSFSLKIAEFKGEDFSAALDRASFKMIPSDYQVSIGKPTTFKFVQDTPHGQNVYYVAGVKKHSTI